MGRRSRQRRPEKLSAPSSTYATADGGALELRGALTPATRREYAAVLAGSDRPAATLEDAWARGVEFLFERLAVRWEVSGVEWTGQRELLGRFRMASREERSAVRIALREHLAEWFPDLQAP